MGKVVGAAILAHVPTIMLPQDVRFDLNEGKEITLVPGLKRLRAEVMETLDYDTVVVLDSHWATTVEFVITAQAIAESSRVPYQPPCTVPIGLVTLNCGVPRNTARPSVTSCSE